MAPTVCKLTLSWILGSILFHAFKIVDFFTRVHGGYEAREDEALCGGELLLLHHPGHRVVHLEGAEHPGRGQPVQAVPDGEGVEQGPEYREDHDGHKVVEESIIVKSQGGV